MRAVIQRVKEASVSISGEVTSEIGLGLLILLGVEDADTATDVEWLSGKVARLRIFSDRDGLMNQSVVDIDGQCLVVSQFTLHASTKKGNRPSFIKAARPDVAVPLYEQFIAQLERDLGKQIATGNFGAMMDIHLVNDGPVTIFIDTQQKE